MKELTYFKLRNCPYCRQADAWLSELRGERADFAALPIRVVVENEEKALADAYDYYYVPCFFLGEEKLCEGAATKEKLRGVLEAAVSANP